MSRPLHQSFRVEVTLRFDHNGGSAWVDLVDHEHGSVKFDVVEGGDALGGDSLLELVYWFGTFAAGDYTRLVTMVGGSKPRRGKGMSS
jgi:hypothetical protein